MVPTQTTPRPATAPATPPPTGRVARVGRLAFGVMFVGGAAVHLAIVATGTETYRHFADTAFIPFVRQAWRSVFMPHAALFGLLLAAFELTVGLLILAGGRRTTLGLLAAVAFHLGLMLFGWGFWVWSLPMLAVLVALLGGGTAPRELARGAAAVLVASPRFLTAPLYRHWHLRWGAADAEVAAAMPGDELVPEPSFIATRAITIAAPPEDVWPWIVQLGTGRAGFYSYDLFDNGGRPSADRILAEFQATRVGDWVPMSSKVNQTTAFKVVAFEVNRWLLWAKPHSTWAWRLTPVDGGGTRLVTRLKEQYPWRSSPGLALLTVVLFEFGDFPMMRRLLLGIRRRAERLAARGLAAQGKV